MSIGTRAIIKVISDEEVNRVEVAVGAVVASIYSCSQSSDTEIDEKAK
jgi:hypothetical protein